jgi:hypothetical protein
MERKSERSALRARRRATDPKMPVKRGVAGERASEDQVGVDASGLLEDHAIRDALTTEHGCVEERGLVGACLSDDDLDPVALAADVEEREACAARAGEARGLPGHKASVRGDPDARHDVGERGGRLARSGRFGHADGLRVGCERGRGRDPTGAWGWRV